ncbi:hypothetical protein KY306_02565 [Candidatus Woesearchaeota archaeon]|nr:hypothetical protein [Candidatus Woesearchaeota archaeon]
MKKYSVLLVLVCLMFIVGCVSGNYFKVPTEDTANEENELIKEIQEIEKQLKSLEEDEAVEEVEELNEELEEEVVEEIDEEETEEIEEELEEAVDTSNLEKLEVQETDLVNLEIEVQDLDQDKVTYTFSKPLNEEGRWQTNYGDAGEYVITITADDGMVTSTKQILLVVKKKNVPPVITNLESIMKAKEGDIIVLTPKVSDPNKDEVEITFPSPFDELGIWETDHTSAGTYDLAVKASDGEMDVEFTIKLTVTDVNVPPKIEGVKSSMTVKEGEKVTIKPTVTDLDGDQVTVTISEPVGDDGVWETSYTDHGEYVVTITADDGKDKVTFTVDLTVEDVNVPPQIIGVRLG